PALLLPTEPCRTPLSHQTTYESAVPVPTVLATMCRSPELAEKLTELSTVTEVGWSEAGLPRLTYCEVPLNDSAPPSDGAPLDVQAGSDATFRPPSVPLLWLDVPSLAVVPEASSRR